MSLVAPAMTPVSRIGGDLLLNGTLVGNVYQPLDGPRASLKKYPKLRKVITQLLLRGWGQLPPSKNRYGSAAKNMHLREIHKAVIEAVASSSSLYGAPSVHWRDEWTSEIQIKALTRVVDGFTLGPDGQVIAFPYKRQSIFTHEVYQGEANTLALRGSTLPKPGSADDEGWESARSSFSLPAALSLVTPMFTICATIWSHSLFLPLLPQSSFGVLDGRWSISSARNSTTMAHTK